MKFNLSELQTEFQKAIQYGDLEKFSHLPINETSQFTLKKRFSVYANAYEIRMSKCLEEDFPTAFNALKETWPKITLDYMREYPSKYFSLSEISLNFPIFLSKNFPNLYRSAIVDLAKAQAAVSAWPFILEQHAEQILNLDELQSLPPEQIQILWNTSMCLLDDTVVFLGPHEPVALKLSSASQAESEFEKNIFLNHKNIKTFSDLIETLSLFNLSTEYIENIFKIWSQNDILKFFR